MARNNERVAVRRELEAWEAEQVRKQQEYACYLSRVPRTVVVEFARRDEDEDIQSVG